MTRQSDATSVIRFGLIGVGRAGGGMLDSMVRHPRVRVTAAADVRQNALDAFAREVGGETYRSAEDLCRSPNVDAVYIGSPHQFHGPQAIAALEHGKHVILEKPMGLTLEECDTMIALAERKGLKLLVGRGSHGFDTPVLKVRELVRSGEYGRLGMINTWHYGNFMYQARTPEELDTNLGGGVIFNQGPHQIDLIRVIGGGMLRSVRAMTGIWDQARRSEGAYAAYLEFVDGAGATMVYSGYDHFQSDEFHYWIGTYGQPEAPGRYGEARRALRAAAQAGRDEATIKAEEGYGGARTRSGRRREAEAAETHQVHWGVTIVSCERADLRQSPNGIYIYGDNGREEVSVPAAQRSDVLDEFCHSVLEDRPLKRDGRWEKGTLEVCLALLESGRERREIVLQHQVPLNEDGDD